MVYLRILHLIIPVAANSPSPAALNLKNSPTLRDEPDLPPPPLPSSLESNSSQGDSKAGGKVTGDRDDENRSPAETEQRIADVAVLPPGTH